jgi:hypothetical protein
MKLKKLLEDEKNSYVQGLAEKILRKGLYY